MGCKCGEIIPAKKPTTCGCFDNPPLKRTKTGSASKSKSPTDCPDFVNPQKLEDGNGKKPCDLPVTVQITCIERKPQELEYLARRKDQCRGAKSKAELKPKPSNESRECECLFKKGKRPDPKPKPPPFPCNNCYCDQLAIPYEVEKKEVWNERDWEIHYRRFNKLAEPRVLKYKRKGPRRPKRRLSKLLPRLKKLSRPRYVRNFCECDPDPEPFIRTFPICHCEAGMGYEWYTDSPRNPCKFYSKKRMNEMSKPRPCAKCNEDIDTTEFCEPLKAIPSVVKRYRATKRIIALSKPIIHEKKEDPPRCLGYIPRATLRYKATPRILSLARPVCRCNANERPRVLGKVDKGALKAKATPRIQRLARANIDGYDRGICYCHKCGRFAISCDN